MSEEKTSPPPVPINQDITAGKPVSPPNRPTTRDGGKPTTPANQGITKGGTTGKPASPVNRSITEGKK